MAIFISWGNDTHVPYHTIPHTATTIYILPTEYILQVLHHTRVTTSFNCSSSIYHYASLWLLNGAHAHIIPYWCAFPLCAPSVARDQGEDLYIRNTVDGIRYAVQIGTARITTDYQTEPCGKKSTQNRHQMRLGYSGSKQSVRSRYHRIWSRRREGRKEGRALWYKLGQQNQLTGNDMHQPTGASEIRLWSGKTACYHRTIQLPHWRFRFIYYTTLLIPVRFGCHQLATQPAQRESIQLRLRSGPSRKKIKK